MRQMSLRRIRDVIFIRGETLLCHIQIGSGRTKKITLGLIVLIVDFCAANSSDAQMTFADGAHFNLRWFLVLAHRIPIVVEMKRDENVVLCARVRSYWITLSFGVDVMPSEMW